MFNWLKKLFGIRDEVIIKINYDLLRHDRNILSYENIYTIIGMRPYITEMIMTNKWHKYHYRNIQASSNTYKKLNEILRDNLLHTKNKFSRKYSEKYILNIQAMDALMWSPYTNEKLADGEIRIILPGHKDFIQVTEKDIKS